MVNKLCDLDESAFMFVAAVFLLFVPKFIALSISGMLFTIMHVRSLTNTPEFGSSLRSSFLTPFFYSTSRS
jgi:hypothetical protein